MPLNANSSLLKRARTGGLSFTATGVEYDPSSFLGAPSAPTVSTAGTGGTVAAGVYGVEVTYVNGNGESIASSSSSVTTTGATSTITVTSPSAYSTATGWYAYVTQANGSTYTRQQAAGSPTAIGTNLTITAPPTSTGLNPPTSDTTGVGTPGVIVTPTDYIPGRSNALKPSMARAQEKLQTNTRFTLRVDEPTIETNEGANTFILNPTLGLNYFFGGLGGQASQSAVTATTTGPATTNTQYTTLPVTGNFVAGRPVIVNTGSSSEPSIIYAYSPGSLQVFAVQTNATCPSGTTVTMPAETKYANSLMSTSALNTLPLLTTYKVIGGDYCEVYPSTLVETLTFTMGLASCDVAAGLFGTVGRSIQTKTTTPAMPLWAPSTTAENTAMRPFTAMNAMLVTYVDVDGTGSQVQAAVGIRDAKITYNNALVKEQVLGNSTMQAWPGDDVSCLIEYTLINTARRPATYIDAIKTGQGTQMYFAYAKNLGTTASPTWRFVVFEIPYARYIESTEDDALNKTNTDQIKAHALISRGLSNDLLIVHVV